MRHFMLISNYFDPNFDYKLSKAKRASNQIMEFHNQKRSKGVFSKIKIRGKATVKLPTRNDKV